MINFLDVACQQNNKDALRHTVGFRRKEFRGKLAIAITANFVNRNTTAEAKVEEISGVAFIFNQKFFQDLREATGQLLLHRETTCNNPRYEIYKGS